LGDGNNRRTTQPTPRARWQKKANHFPCLGPWGNFWQKAPWEASSARAIWSEPPQGAQRIWPGLQPNLPPGGREKTRNSAVTARTPTPSPRSSRGWNPLAAHHAPNRTGRPCRALLYVPRGVKNHDFDLVVGLAQAEGRFLIAKGPLGGGIEMGALLKAPSGRLVQSGKEPPINKI